MLRLNLQPSAWRDVVPGVRIEIRRPEPLDRRAAFRAARAAREAAEQKGCDAEEATDAAHAAFALALAARCIVAWDGVADDQGAPLQPTPEAIRAFMTCAEGFEAVDEHLVRPQLRLGDEKNGSGRSPAGTSAAPTPERPTARTVPSRAKRVRTKSTSSKQTKAKRSGK